jgi:N-acetylmuramoyl-L-alanine amidase
VFPASRTAWRTAALVALGATVAFGLGISVAAARPAQSRTQEAAVSDQRQKDFAAAAKEFGVPENVLLAVSYTLTGWAERSGQPSASGGYGLMHLADAGSGTDSGLRTLAEAARLAHIPADRVRTNPAENVRAGAALLARYARDASGGNLPTSTVGWYGAIARYGTGGDSMAGRSFADDVLTVLRTGVPATVVGGQRLQLAASPDSVLPKIPGAGKGFAGQPAADCPTELSCRFVPAGIPRTAARPAGTAIQSVVLQPTAGTYDATILAGQRRTPDRTLHYVVRADGAVTQMVRTSDVATHAGNQTIDTGSVGVAVEGARADDGGVLYTDAAYRSAAALVRWLAGQYDIPLDRGHLLGVDEVPAAGRPVAGLAGSWDWVRFMQLLGAPVTAQAWRADLVVTFAPPGHAVGSGSRGGTVRLLAEPRDGAAVVSDRAVAGQSFGVAGHQGSWTAVWYGGQRAWFADPESRLAVPGDGVLVGPAAGKAEVPVYASTVGSTTLGSIPAGQAYLLVEPVPGPLGSPRFLLVRFDGRLGYVAVDDVQVTGLS